MTEADWLTGTDFAAHVRFVSDRLSPRRTRLLAAGFCRAVGHLFDHPELNDALTAIERYADGDAPVARVETVRRRCRKIAQKEFETYRAATDRDDLDNGLREYVRSELAWAVAFAATSPLPVEEVGARAAAAAARFRARAVPLAPGLETEFEGAKAEEAIVMRGVVWDVVGNPFRSVRFTDWRTDTVVSLARHMYQSAEFGAMPILADAIQDAGCDNEDVLDHCRHGQGHVRGCWVLDGVLGHS